MNDLISIIVPIYNVEKYLDKCIESIIEQTYNNLEIILVDDGSPDNCAEICDEYAEKDSRIVVIHKDNGGVSSARNTGLKVAKGSYIGFVDPDDYITDEMYERMLTTAKLCNADIVLCDYAFFGENGDIYKDSIKGQGTGRSEYIDQYQSQLLYFNEVSMRTSLVVMWNKLFKKDIISDIIFPSGKIHEDEAVTFSLLYKAKKIIYLRENLYYYLDRRGSIMDTDIKKNRFNIFDAYIKRLVFYEEYNEKELYKKVILLYMHMLCQYADWSSKSKTKNKQEIIYYHNLLLDNVNLSNIEIAMKQKIEFWLFKYFNIYKKLWKFERLIRC